MNFQELVERDNAAFVNPGEFGTTILWNGEPVYADVADGEIESSDYRGVNIRTRTVTVDAGAVAAPVPDESVQVDGEFLRVKEVADDFGLLEVTFYRNES